jgi:hypothetical protein
LFWLSEIGDMPDCFKNRLRINRGLSFGETPQDRRSVRRMRLAIEAQGEPRETARVFSCFLLKKR